MKKIIFLFVVMSLQSAVSQISNNSMPYTMLNNTPNLGVSIGMEVVLPFQDLNKALQEDAIDDQNGLAPRFGLINEVNFSMSNSGVWINLDNGDKIWRLQIKSPEARSVNLNYSEFYLPKGSSLHIYNKNKSHIIGGFTHINNQGTKEDPGEFATGLVYGDNIILEYYQNNDVNESAAISISQIIHGYKNIKVLKSFSEDDVIDEAGFGDSGACQVNINCSEGNNWQDEKKGIALILVGGNRLCSGSLVNNANEDNKPYFLTANHCIGALDALGNTNASNYTFYWNYESSDCLDGLSEPTIESTSGATLIANNDSSTASDFALFELTESPFDANFDIYFNGWDRTSTPSQGGVGIHHPSGDIKKIATHSVIPSPGIVYNSNTHWRVNWSSTSNGHSVTEGGSSGSPLFLNNGRIIGQLHGGSSINCSNPAADPGEYGRFGVSWNGSVPERRLSDWLDPNNTGIGFLDGLIPDFPDEILGNSILCTNSQTTFTFTNNNNLNVVWSVSSNLEILNFSNASITVESINSFTRGLGFVNAATSNGTVQSDFWVGKPSFPQLTTSSGVPYDEFNLPAGCANGVTHWIFKTSNPLDKVTAFEFSVLGGPIITKNASNGLATISAQDLGMVEGTTLDVTVRPVNICGSNALVPKFKLYRPTDCECGIGINCNLNIVEGPIDTYTVYPNPTSDFINIVLSAGSLPPTTESKIVATLYDMLGEEKKSVTIKKDKASINVNNLTTGIYILKIDIDGVIESHLIAVN